MFDENVNYKSGDVVRYRDGDFFDGEHGAAYYGVVEYTKGDTTYIKHSNGSCWLDKLELVVEDVPYCKIYGPGCVFEV